MSDAAVEADGRRAAGQPTATTWLDKIALAIVAAGVLLRVWILLAGRSVWGDEAMIASSIMGRSFAGLLEPLDYHQAAPIGWLMLERLAYLLIADVEVALRFWPTLSGIAGLLLMAGLCRRELGRLEALFCLTAAALLPTYLYFSVETKPYITDFALAAALMLVGGGALDQGRTTARRLIALLLLGLVAVPLSNPAAFVLAGVGTALFLQAALAGRWREATGIALVALAWALLALGLYLGVYRHHVANTWYQQGFWDWLFAPLPPRSFRDLLWYYKALMALPNAAFFLGRFYDPGWVVATGLVALLLLLGALRLVRAAPLKAVMWLLPVGCALVASALGMYPFGGRLLLFAAPAMLLLAAIGLGELAVGRQRPLLLAAVPALVLALPLSVTLFEVARPGHRPFDRPSIKSVLPLLAAGYRPGDAIYIAYGSAWVPFLFYRGAYGLDGARAVMGRDGLGRALAEVEQLRDAPRVWLLQTEHNPPGALATKRAALLEAASYALGRFGRETQRHSFDGATLSLFELDPEAVARLPTLFAEPADAAGGEDDAPPAAP